MGTRLWDPALIARAIDEHPAGRYGAVNKANGEAATAYFLQLSMERRTGQYVVRTDSGEIIQITKQKLGLEWDIDSSIDLSVGV